MPTHISGMTTTAIRRVRPGVPAGGQFAVNDHADAGLELTGDETSQEPASPEPAESIVERESMYTQKYASTDEKLAALQGEIAGHVAALADDENWHDYLNAMSQFHRYSFGNQMLIAMQTRGQATRVAGFNKWKELDRSVMKGEKGITILAPKMIRKGAEDSNGKPVIGADGKPVKKSQCVGFTTATVFDISQTDGKPLPDDGMTLTETPPEGLKEDLEKAITDSGYTVSYEEIHGGARGYTSPSEKKVVIKSGMTPASEASTLAHELGHIKAGHTERTDEYHTGEGGQRGNFEVEADSVAYVLLRTQGMSTKVGAKTGRYVAGWGGSGPEAVKASAEIVQKTVKDLLANNEWRNTAPNE